MKNIVFCADGTWNGPDRDDIPEPTDQVTNVFRLFSTLEGLDDAATLRAAGEQERRTADGAQVAKYLHGVGDSANPLVKLLGGAFGAGLIARVVRGYTFISREYRAGDRIYLTGFSRGAYTARALAGMIAAMGLLDATRLKLDDRERAYRLGAAVWHAWRRKAGGGKRWLADLDSIVQDLPGFLGQPLPAEMIADVPVEAVGVWDTVGSLGIPDYVGLSGREDAFRFADVALSPKVKFGFHALAVDERRADFAPTYWQPDRRIIQCLFPGAHADVGGGYPMTNRESCLSDAAFEWMRENFAAVGVRFRPDCPFPLDPDPTGPAHQPWLDIPFNLRAQGPRELPPGLSLSQPLRDRLKAGLVQPGPDQPPRKYNPVNLGDYL